MDKNDPTIKIELKVSELFQLHLSVISRSAFATQKWASVANAEEQTQMQNEIAFLGELDKKLIDILNDVNEGKN